MNAANCAGDYFGEAEFQHGPAPWEGRIGDLMIFIISASQVVELNIVGRLFAPDIISLTVLPVALLFKGRFLNRKMPRTFLVLGLVWFAGQLATDMILLTPFSDYARGWSVILFTMTNFSVLYVLVFQNERRIVIFAFGFAIGTFLLYFLNPSIYAEGDPWKFGYGFGITLLVVLLATVAAIRSKSSVAVALMLLTCALNFYKGFRSLGGECFFVAAFLLMKQLALTQRERGRRLSLGGALVASALLFLSGAGILRAYSYYASTGMLGDAAFNKYEMQSSGRYGVLMGGRTEFLVGIEAVLDSPIIGHGSWAKDWHYASRIQDLRSDAGYREVIGPADSWLIPSHSHLIGAWVNAGILGAFFWGWVLSLPLKALRQLYAAAEPLTPLIAFLAIILIWDVLFSPYGAERRYLTAYYIVVMMSVLVPIHGSTTLPPKSGERIFGISK